MGGWVVSWVCRVGARWYAGNLCHEDSELVHQSVLTCHVYLDGVGAGALRVGDGAGHHHVEHLPGEAGDQEDRLLR